MTGSEAKEELERIQRFLRRVEQASFKDISTLASDAGRHRRAIDDVIRYIRDVED